MPLLCIDRLSALPDSLIIEILSNLCMRDVVRTTLLSKIWKNLWITIPCLSFDYDDEEDSVQFRIFVNRVLMLWKGTHLRKFEIINCADHALNEDVNLWILFAKERKVEELSVHLFSPSLFECSSLRKLKLSGCHLQNCGNLKWDRLNCLVLSYGSFSEGAINEIFSSSPQLETFKCVYNHRSPNLNIRSSSLKNLWLCTGADEVSVLTIWAPNLQSLEFFGQPYKQYLLTNVSSLTNVCIGFKSYSSSAKRIEEALSQIFPAIQHVVTVALSADCFQMLGVMNDKYLVSPLSNVELLKIDCGFTKLSELVALLEIFPKVKMLKIDWKLEYNGKSFKFIRGNYIASQASNILKSNLFQLRTFEITCYSPQVSMFEVIEFMLKYATMLEKMVVRKG